MLVLTRQRDESIQIGDDVSVTVVDVRGDKVRLGTDAPKEIPVHRKEVYDAIRGENRATGGRRQLESLWHGGVMYEVWHTDAGWRAEIRGVQFYAVAPNRERVAQQAREKIDALALAPGGKGARC